MSGSTKKLSVTGSSSVIGDACVTRVIRTWFRDLRFSRPTARPMIRRQSDLVAEVPPKFADISSFDRSNFSSYPGPSVQVSVAWRLCTIAYLPSRATPKTTFRNGNAVPLATIWHGNT